MFLNSNVSNTVAMIAASRSDTGPEYIIPSIPIKNGRITNKGSRKMICLVRARNVPFAGFPIDDRNVDDIGWVLFKNVKNR